MIRQRVVVVVVVIVVVVVGVVVVVVIVVVVVVPSKEQNKLAPREGIRPQRLRPRRAHKVRQRRLRPRQRWSAAAAGALVSGGHQEEPPPLGRASTCKKMSPDETAGEREHRSAKYTTTKRLPSPRPKPRETTGKREHRVRDHERDPNPIHTTFSNTLEKAL